MLTRLLSPVDARYQLLAAGTASSKPTGLTTVYRSGVGKVMSSDCEMLPSDSRYYDAISRNCGPMIALYRTSARLLLETEASFEWLPAALNRGKIRWLDVPSPCAVSTVAVLPPWRVTPAVVTAKPVVPPPAPATPATPSQASAPSQTSVMPSSGVRPAAEAAVAACEPRQLARCKQLVTQVRTLLQGHRAFEAHVTATAGAAVCDCEGDRLRYWDAHALHTLDDAPTANALWRDLLIASSATSDTVAADARLAMVWSLLISHDDQAADALAAPLAPDARLRLRTWRHRQQATAFRVDLQQLSDATLQREAAVLQQRMVGVQHSRRPWLAASLSALIPGAGQLYTGSYQGAAMSFVLNSVLIATTVEFARHDLYWAAGASGLVASVFYIGGIINAADLASRENQRAGSVPEAALTRILLPELTP